MSHEGPPPRGSPSRLRPSVFTLPPLVVPRALLLLSAASLPTPSSPPRRCPAASASSPHGSPGGQRRPRLLSTSRLHRPAASASSGLSAAPAHRTAVAPCRPALPYSTPSTAMPTGQRPAPLGSCYALLSSSPGPAPPQLIHSTAPPPSAAPYSGRPRRHPLTQRPAAC